MFQQGPRVGPERGSCGQSQEYRERSGNRAGSFLQLATGRGCCSNSGRWSEGSGGLLLGQVLCSEPPTPDLFFFFF